MSSNNRKELVRKMTEQRQRFALRKYTVGVASVLIGLTFVGGVTGHADVAHEPVSETSVSQQNQNATNKASDIDSHQVAQDTDKGTTVSATSTDHKQPVTTNDTNPANNQTTLVVKNKTTNQQNAEHPVPDLSVSKTASRYNVNDWGYSTTSDGIILGNYIGQGTDFYIPNAKSFRDAGKITAGQKVYLRYDFIRNLVQTRGATSISIERAADANDKVVAVGYQPSGTNLNKLNAAFGDPNYYHFSGDHAESGNNIRLKSVDLAGLDVSNITDMSGLFANDQHLESVTGLDTWKFSPNMGAVGHMFAFDTNLKTIQGIENWDTSNFKYIDNLVVGDTNLTNLNLGNWKTDQVILANDMFNGASQLTNVGDLSGWQLNNATSTANMFKKTQALHSVGNLSRWGLAKDEYLNNMFTGSGITAVNVSNWNLKNGIQANDMFTDLKNKAKITMNGDQWANAGLKATDFSGNQPLIVISNALSQDLNTQNIGNNQKGHPANTVHFYGRNTNGASEELGSQQENFVFSSEDALADQLAKIGQNPNVKKVISNTLSDQTIAEPEGNTDFDKLAGNYQVMESVHRQYRVIEDYPGNIHPILTFNGSFERPMIKNADGTFTYPNFAEPNATNGMKVVGSWTDKDGHNAQYQSDQTAGQTIYDLAPDGYTLHFPNGADREQINQKRWAEVEQPIWLKNWYVRDHVNADWKKDNHLTVDIFQGSESVAEMPTDQDFHITYTANPQSIQYQFVDDDKKDSQGNPTPVKSFTVTGVTHQTVDPSQTVKVPDNYKLAAGESIPTNYKFKASNNEPVTIRLVHKTQDVTTAEKNDPVTSTFHIIENLPDGTQKTIWTLITTQYRQATKDLVTGKITYGKYTDVSGKGEDPNNSYEMRGQDWHQGRTTAPNDGTAGTGSYDVINGYTAQLNENKLPAASTPLHITYNQSNHTFYVDVYYGQQPVDEFPKSKDFYIDYVGNDTHQDYRYLYTDRDGHQHVIGSDGQVMTDPNAISTTVHGKTGAEISVPSLPAGWVTEDGKAVSGGKFKPQNEETTIQVRVKHNQIPVTPDQVTKDHPLKGDGTKVPGDDKAKDDITYSDLHKTITRTITITKPGKQPYSKTQTVTLTRNATIDDVTGDVHYGAWSTDTFPEFDEVPAVPGYTASQTKVDAASASVQTGDQVVNISYTANDQTGKISYVDDQGNEVGSTLLTGKTGEQVPVNVQIPAGWRQVDGQRVPDHVTVGADGVPTVSVKVEHARVTVQPTDPKTAADKLPDNPAKRYPSGVSHDDLNKTITRTITIVKPDGTQESHQQSAHLTRTATVDEVTGKVTYGQWSTGHWDDYAVPEVPGYVPSQNVVAGQDVTINTVSGSTKIHYTANFQGHDNGSTRNDNNGQSQLNHSTDTKSVLAKSSGTQSQHQLPQTGNDQDARLGAVGLTLASLTGLFGLAKLGKKKTD
ncbi:BspA family leucine-rich repeat surface protein [uncultured Limosilactobacillus sp.]|uniref:mucin-binding protein n=1 Tax=uncultured Limosilactobacillus sp. TaxID=2837629 RepID=UPI0026007E86|nr:BspA family leucine-rich repeat surface protein [uncultured Limosilactobacillus sp.]